MRLAALLTILGLSCLALVLFSTATGLAVQQPGSSASSTRPDIARVENGRFISDYLGIQFPIPSNWMVTDVGDGRMEPRIVDGRKVFLLLRVVSSKAAGESGIVLRVVDRLHKDIDSEDLSVVDEPLPGSRPSTRLQCAL